MSPLVEWVLSAATWLFVIPKINVAIAWLGISYQAGLYDVWVLQLERHVDCVFLLARCKAHWSHRLSNKTPCFWHEKPPFKLFFQGSTRDCPNNMAYYSWPWFSSWLEGQSLWLKSVHSLDTGLEGTELEQTYRHSWKLSHLATPPCLIPHRWIK